MISVARQFLLNVLCASVSVGGVFLLLKIFSQWMDGHFNLRWKKLLYLFLTIRLLIPINMQIPYYNIKTDSLTRDIVDFSGKAETDINNYSKNFLLPLNINIEAGHYKISVHAVLFFIWVIGFLIYFVFTFTGYIINRHKILQDTITANNIHKVAINICEEIGLSKIPVILYSPIKISPMVLGVLKPILLLPETGYSDEEIYFILKHELIHLKRKDNIYKYILQLANAIHWFNPLVYMFVSEASLNLEFLCDEEVVKNSSLDIRKRYTYAILNSASKIAGPPLKYFTKFQENKRIMKKRFRNIIKKSYRKCGLSVFGTAIVMTLLCGIFLSYFLSFSEVNSKNKANSNIQHLKNNEPPKLQMQQENDTEVETSETQTIGGTKDTIEKGNQADNITIIPTDNVKDMLEIQKIIYDFADAYFKGDIDAVKQYMENPDKANVYKNNKKEGIYISCLKGLDDLQAGKQVHKITSSLEFLTSEMPDSYTYLTINLVRVKNSWKISWYGLEL